MLFKELHPVDIATGKPETWVRMELQPLQEHILGLLGGAPAQLFKHQQDALEQAVLADMTIERRQSSGCWPMRGAHWYTSPCVLFTTSSW
ncbi:hypothetical protein D9M68_764500 [compost metagenome]